MDWIDKVFGNPGRGKLADSQDCFRFSYIGIDPRRENFSVSATFRVEDSSGADFQSGYGIMVVDTVENPSELAVHRNHLLLGRFRSLDGRHYSCGVRVVGGYTDRKALRQDGRRKLDPSRLFPTREEDDVLRPGDERRFRLEKTDEGFTAAMYVGDKVEIIVFPGHDFLLRQDRGRIYVGFAVAGDIKVSVSDIHFESRPGRLGRTPSYAISALVPDYPFDHSLVLSLKPSPAPDPVDLVAAISQAVPGGEIVLPDGVYKGGPYYIPGSRSGKPGRPIILRAEHPGKAVIDGSSFPVKLPAMILRGNFWHIEGIVFRGSPSCGLHVCGSDNEVRHCEACANGDTGILICSFPGTSGSELPARNRIERCVSHDNSDTVRRNADGFGAKLSVGEGNGFYSCRAFHNIDDGFDLYTKSTLGPIAPVVLDNCEASYNGWLSVESRPSGEVRTGIGFKLGGENQKVAHRVVWSAAHHNARAGFDSNSNAAVTLLSSEAWDNGVDYKMPETRSSFVGTLGDGMSSFRLYMERKFWPKFMLHNPFSDNKYSVARFEAIIPELKYYYREQVFPQLCRQALLNGFHSLDKYHDFVVSDHEALSKLRRNLTFLGSHFFRGEIWPGLREICRDAFQGTSKDKIRVWCAGCSEGKEVYSILMVLLDFLPARKIELLATDYNLEMVKKSRAGIYPLRIVKEIPPEYRHYVDTLIPDEDSEFKRIKLIMPQFMREMVSFRLHNLISDDYPEGFDLILCRNVMKFFEEGTRRGVAERLSASLNDGGYLVVSDDLKRESIEDPGSMGLVQLDGSCVYRKRSGS